MVYRFVSLVWNKVDARAASVADSIAAQLRKISPHTWEKVYESKGLMVLQSGQHKGRMQAYNLQAGAHGSSGGVVLGRLFHYDAEGLYPSKTDDFGASESELCLRTKGQHLVDNYWGRYVTFLDDQAANAKYIMRDPCGDFPCFSTPYEGVDIYFSDMGDCARFEFLNFTVNWDYIKKNIALPFIQKTHTGLNEVAEILPAECLDIGPDGTKSRFTWDPAKISQTDMIKDVEEAAELVRKTVKKCVAAWADCYDNILHRIGGLDSSIVLACLAEAPNRPDITCSTFFSPAPSFDERSYTRQATKQAGVPLVEHALDYKNVNLERMFHMNRIAKPFPYFNGIDRGCIEVRLAREKGAQAIFSGLGGDQIFFHGPVIYSAHDYVHHNGIDINLLKVTLAAARQGRRSGLSTLSEVVKKRYSGQLQDPFETLRKDLFSQRKTMILNPEIMESYFSQHALHPLLKPTGDVPIGKYFQILMTALFSVEYYEPSHRQEFVEPVHPLLSQPLIELCLRIPTWILSLGGIDRGLARKAFEHDVPRDIIRRQTKGSPYDYYQNTYNENRGFIREFLLNGILAQENIVLQDNLEMALSEGNLGANSEYTEILYHVSLEAWLRSWIDRKGKNIKMAV